MPSLLDNKKISSRTMRPAVWRAAVLLAALVHIAYGQIPAADDLGCFAESKRTRLYTYPPGNFVPGSVTPDYCRYKCQADGFQYVSVTEGKICFCGRAAPAGSSVDAAVNCNLPCSGEATLTCGGPDHAHVYKTPDVVDGLTLNEPASQLLTFAEGIVPAVVSAGASVTYELDYGDNTMKKADAAADNVHRFRQHGKKEVIVKGTDMEGNTQMTSKTVNVMSSITGADLTGPEAYEVGERFENTLTVATGSGMSGTLSFDNSDSDESFTMEDSTPISVGIASGTVDAATSNVNQLYLMMNDVFHYDAKLMGFDFYIKNAGTLTVAVFRPKCAEGEVFCFRSYTCIAETATCAKQTNRWRHTCTGSNKYSMTQQACVNPSTGALAVDGTLMPATWAGLPVQEFSTVYSAAVTVTAAGQGYHAVTEDVEVAAGDFIGFMADGADVLGLETAATERVEYAAAPGGSVDTALVVPGAATYAPVQQRHMLRGHAVRPARLVYRKIYSVIGEYDMGATVTNLLGSTTVNHMVDIQEAIDEIPLTCPEHIATNASVTFTIANHAGNKVTYNWTFDDGGTDSKYDDKTQAYTYIQAGVYFVEIYAYNKISWAVANCTVIIQDCIQDLNVSAVAVATVLTQPALVDVTISQGTNVSFSVDVADGIQAIETVTWDGTGPAWTANLAWDGFQSRYVYTAIGNYTFKVTASNLVCNEEKTIYLPVQIVIEDWTIVQPVPLAKGEEAIVYLSMSAGSNLEMTANVNGTAVTAIDMSETNFRGFVTLAADFFSDIGTYSLTATADNWVTDLLQDQASLRVDYRPFNLAVTSDDDYVIPGTVVTLNVTMDQASDYQLQIDWDDGDFTDDFQDLTLAPTVLQYSHTFIDIKPHTVNVTISNGISALSVQVVVTVQGDVRYLQLDCPTPGTIPYKAPMTLTCTITHPATLETACVDGSDEFFCGLSSDDHSVIGQTDDRCQSVTCTPTTCTSSATATCQAPVACSLPTDPQYSVTWDDGSTPDAATALDVDDVVAATHSDSHSYTAYGTYSISVSVSNQVGSQVMQQTVDLDQSILNLQAWAEPVCVRVNSPVEVHATLGWGSRFNGTWIWQDGTANTVQSYELYNETMIGTHTYTTPDHYEVQVELSNRVNLPPGVTHQLVNEETVIAEYEPRDLELRCTPNTLLSPDSSPPFTAQTECNIFRGNNVPAPTDAFYTVDFGNGNKKPKTSLTILNDPTKDDVTHTFTHAFTNTLGYKQGGTFLVAVRIWNCVGEQNLTFEVNIFEKIFNMEKSPYIHEISGNTTTIIPGYDNDEYFPIERPVAFQVTLDRGSHVTYKWDFGDGTAEEVTTVGYILHKFAEPGTYTIKLNASNPMDTVLLQNTLTVQRSIDPDFKFYSDTPTYPKNRTFNFFFDTGLSATDACYCVDFLDTAGLQPVHFAAGDLAQCDITCPGTGRRIAYTADQLAADPVIYTQFHYMTKGLYNLHYIAENKVSRVEDDYELIVTRGPCFKPVVKLATNPENICTPGVNCGENNMKQYKRANTIQISAKVTTNCESTKLHYYTWVFERQNPTTGEWGPTDFPVVRTEASWLGSVQDGNKVSKLCEYPQKMINVVIPPKLLQYGNYKLTLNVSMEGEIGIETIGSMMFEVSKSDLVGGAGSASARYKWNANKTIELNVVDPDCDETREDCSAGWDYGWYCRRRCDKWGTFSADMRTYDMSTYLTECIYEDGDAEPDRGCFKFDEVDGPGELLNKEGFYDIDSVTGSIKINTFYMYESDYHVFKVLTFKDTRMLELEIEVFLTLGEPPDTKLECINNCGQKVNSKSELKLQSLVKGAWGIPHLFWWYLYEVVQTSDPDAEPEYNLMNPEVVAAATSTGTLIDNVAFNKDFFEPPFIHPDKRYKIVVRALRAGSSDPNNYGESSQIFQINRVPTAGKCKVLPEWGIATETLFRWECSTPFGPSVLPTKYEVLTRTKSTAAWTLSGKLTSSELEDGATFTLGPGDSANNNTLQIGLKCIDGVGSFTTVAASIWVEGMAADKMLGALAALTGGGGAGDSEAGAALVNDIKNSGNVGLAVSFLNCFTAAPEVIDVGSTTAAATTSTTTTLAPDGTEEELTEEELLEIERQKYEEEQRRKEAAQQEVFAVVDLVTSVPINNPEDMKMLCSGVASFTADPQSMNENSTNKLTGLVENSMDLLESLEKGSAEDTQDNVMALLAVTGNVLASSSVLSTTDTGIQESGSSGISTSDLLTDDEKKAQQEQGERAQKNIAGMKNTMEKMTGLVMTGMVSGQTPVVISSDKAQLVASKQFTRQLTNAEISVRDGTSAKYPSTPEALVGTGNDTTYTVDAKVTNLKMNSHSYANQSVAMKSDTLDMTTFNDTGGQMEVEDLEDFFEFVLANNDVSEPTSETGYTTPKEEKYSLKHNVQVPAGHSVAITVLPDEELDRDETRKDREVEFEEHEEDDYIVLLHVAIRFDEVLKIDEPDTNCTLPLTNAERYEMVKDFKNAWVPYIPDPEPEVLVNWTTAAPLPEDIDECLSSPCENGGMCVDQLLGYVCQCTGRWRGDHCEKINHCPVGWPVAGDHCVYIGNTTASNFSEAQRVCGEKGMFVYEPESWEEMDELMPQMKNASSSHFLGARHNDSHTVWDRTDEWARYLDEGRSYSTVAWNMSTEAPSTTLAPTTVIVTTAAGAENSTGAVGVPEVRRERRCYVLTPEGEVERVPCDEPQGLMCSSKINECSSNPCQYGGTCVDKVDDYECICRSGYNNGKDCAPNNCLTKKGWRPFRDGCAWADSAPRNDENAEAAAVESGSYMIFLNDWEELEVFRGIFPNTTGLYRTSGKFKAPAEGSNATGHYSWSVQTGSTFFEPDNVTVAEEESGECIFLGFADVPAGETGLVGKPCASSAGTMWYRDKPETDECASSPCKNGGTCEDRDKAYECICPDMWEGDQCEILAEGYEDPNAVPMRKSLPDKWTCFLNPSNFGFGNETRVMYGVKARRVMWRDWVNASSAGEAWELGVPEEEEGATATDTDTVEADFPSTTNYSHYTTLPGCMYWRHIDNAEEGEADGEWSTDGLITIPLSDYSRTVCASSHLSEFGGSFVVPMNTINLEESAFTKLDENPLVFAVMVCIMALYCVLCVWARKADKEDELKAGTTPLVDNDPRDKYLYEITVFTGAKPQGGTTAKVRFIITGEEGDTGARLMWDDQREVLQRGASDAFLMACRKPLGTLTHLRIWHSNSGKSPSWFFSRMLVHDIQTNNKFFFICDRWLAVEHEDGMVDRIVPIAGMEELTSFNHLFWSKTRKNLTDGHIWFSVFQRPPSSRFTRVQRLTCCIALLFSSMLASIAFYKADGGEAPKKVFRVGPIEFTPQQIYVGFISGMIAFPANLIIVTLFRMSKERPRKKPKVTSDPNKYKQFQDMAGEDELAKELQREKDMMDTGRPMTPATQSVKPLQPEYGGVSYIDNINGTPQVQMTEDKDKKKKKKKKPLALPWWCIYIAYGLALCVCGVAFWATVEFAGVFGPEKSKEWLISFCISIVESVFLSQPLKVILMALFFALIWKKPDVEEEDERPSHLKPNEEWMHKHMSEEDMKDPEKRKEIEKYKKGPMEIDHDILKAAREERFKEMQMQAIIREIILYLLWLYILMMVAYGNRDPWSYMMTENFDNMFTKGLSVEAPVGKYNMRSMHSRPAFWEWTKNVMIPSLYSEGWYGGNYSNWGHLIEDGAAYRVGQARLRLLRVMPERCKMPIYEMVPECRPVYSFGDEDVEHYHMGWKRFNESVEEPDEYWKYHTWRENDAYPFWGRMGTYSGGGYIAHLGHTAEEAQEVVEELVEHRWLDEYTRAIFIEFLTYNPNLNLFGVSLSVVEFTQTGAGFVTPKHHIMRLDRYFGPFMFVVMGAEVITVCFLIFFIVREVKSFLKQRREYFKSVWNCIEVFILASSIVCIVMFVYRLIVAKLVSAEIAEDPKRFHNFQYVAMWDEIYACFLGIIITFATIKFLKLLRFNKRMGLLTATLRNAGNDLAQYMLMFSIMFFAFTQVAYCMLHTTLYDFSTFIVSAETLFSVMLGKFDFYIIAEASRIWGPLILLAFTLFVALVLVNFFVTIIIDSYEQVKEDLNKQPNEHEIVDFIVARFKKYTGLGEDEEKKKAKKKARHMANPLEVDAEEYVEGADPNAPNAHYLQMRVETMLGKLETYIHFKDDDKAVMREMDDLTTVKRRKKIFSSA